MIDCKEIANDIKEKLKPLVNKNKGLAIIQVGENPASNIYIKHKLKDAEELGIPVHHYHLPEDGTTNDDVLSLVQFLNQEDDIKGIIIQLPLPCSLDAEMLTNAIVDEKDVDGFKVTSKYTPATPKGVMTILDSLGVDLSGKKVCLIGKGKSVGVPLIPLLLERGATLTVCHSRTKPKDLQWSAYSSDIIISATGRTNTVTKDMICFSEDSKPSQIIIDVGISRDENGKQIGDCSRELHELVENISPYTNGVGLMTRVSLLQNLLEE